MACKGTYAVFGDCVSVAASCNAATTLIPAANTIAVRRHSLLLQVLPQAQAARDDGELAFSAVVNIPHSERHSTQSYIRLQTSTVAVSCMFALRSYMATVLSC